MEQARALIDVCFGDVRQRGQSQYFTIKAAFSDEEAVVAGEGGKVE
jgi:hypothetical protein